MANGNFKIWVKNVGNISVSWGFLVDGGVAGDFTLERINSYMCPAYSSYGNNLCYVTGSSTSNGSLPMWDIYDDDWLSITVQTSYYGSGLDVAATIYLEDDTGVVLNNTVSGNEYAYQQYGGILVYSPTGNVTLAMTSSLY